MYDCEIVGKKNTLNREKNEKDTIIRQSDTRTLFYTGPLMARLLQNICSQKFTGVKNREFGDLGKPSLIFSFLAMLFAVQNRSSFTVWFTHREVIPTKKRSRNCVTRQNFRFNAPTAPTEEAESLSIAAWASNTLKCPFHTTHAAKQQARQMENRQLLFSMLDDSGRKEVLEKKMDIIISQRAPWVVALRRPCLEIPHISWCFCRRHTPEPGSSVVVGMEPQMGERGGRRPHRLHLPPPVLLMDYQTFSCPSAKKKKRNPAMRWWLDCNHRRNGRS